MLRQRFSPVAPMQPPVMWIENYDKEEKDFRESWPKPPYLSDEEYGKCMAAFPRVCSDIIAVEPESKRFYLVKRIHHSAIGRWCIGGAQRRGETPEEAAIINLKRETGIQLTLNELSFLFSSEMYWKLRNPKPQELGEQCRVLTYCFVPTAKDIAGINLDSSEYDLNHGVKLYTRKQIEQFPESNRGLLLMFYDAAFGG